jgi:serine/threonine protein phosphatase PrpC
VTSEIGRRAENQDGWILCDRFAGHDGAVFAAVLDGHGTDGRLVAQFVQDTLPERLAAQPDMLTDPPAALVRAFAETQAALLDPESTLQTDFSGATATCILIVKRRLHVAKCAPPLSLQR